MTGVNRPPRGHRRRSDSDSEDELTSDHTSGPDYDSAGDRDEINERILKALERLHQDMKSIISRLSRMEEAVLSQQVGRTDLLVIDNHISPKYSEHLFRKRWHSIIFYLN